MGYMSYTNDVLGLTKTKGGVTTKSVAEQLNISKQLASNILTRLYRQGQVNRTPWLKNSYRYEFISKKPIYIPERRVRARKNTPPVGKPIYHPVDRTSVFGLILRWSEKSWEPKIFSSARNLPLGLARLMQLAVDQRFGASVDRAEVNTVKANINEFYQDLERTLAVVKGILNNEDLWGQDFAVYLTQDKDLDELQITIEQLKEKN